MTAAEYQALTESLMRHEGLKLRAYADSRGQWTVGYGHNISAKPISTRAAHLILEDDIEDAHTEAQSFAWFADLAPVRQRVIVEMIFNLGLPTFQLFRKMIHALAVKNYPEAARQMLDSQWHRDVGTRAETLATLMEQG